MAQLDLLPAITSISIPDLWHVDRKVKNFGRIRALQLPKGTYEVRSSAIVTAEPKKRRIILSNGIEFEVAEKKANGLAAPYGILGKTGTISGVTKWISGPDVYPSPADVVDSWVGNTTLKRADENLKVPGLRNAQLGGVYGIFSHWTLSNEPATIVMPTGTGKTETMLTVAAYGACSRILVVVPSDALRTQVGNKFAAMGILHAQQILSAQAKYPVVGIIEHTPSTHEALETALRCNVLVTTPLLISSLNENARKILDSCSHLFFDEAHHIEARTWKHIKESFGKKPIIQFTATPYRADHQPVEGKIVYNFTVAQAQRENCFETISLFPVHEPNPDKYDLTLAHAAFTRLCEDRAKGYTDHRVMVRTNGKKRAEELLRLYTTEFPNEPATLVLANSPNKRKVIQEILAGKFTFAICVDMLKEGFDFADFKIACVHDLHKSLAVALQFIGRFTRKDSKRKLGQATFLVNLAKEEIPQSLEQLYSDGTGWDQVIAEVATQRQHEAVKLLTFLEHCKPMAGFDAPQQDLNPKIIRPSLSTSLYKCSGVDWSKFSKAFPADQNFALSMPYVNQPENILFFTLQRREKVKWSKSEALRDQFWTVFVLYFDEPSETLYLSCSDSKFPHSRLAESIGKDVELIKGEKVFRCFAGVKRLRVLHAGLYKHADRRHRYSKFSGPDVTAQLDTLKTSKARKSDFVGVGFADGKPTGAACSAKGKLWYPSRRATVPEWKEWCLATGKKVLDESITTEQIFEDTVRTSEVTEFPVDRISLCAEWSNDLLDQLHKPIEIRSAPFSYSLFAAEITVSQISPTTVTFAVEFERGEKCQFQMTLGGPVGQQIVQTTGPKLFIVIGSREHLLAEYLTENPPVVSFVDGSSLEGCLLHELPPVVHFPLPKSQISSLDWKGVDIEKESRYKDGIFRPDSVQQRVINDEISSSANFVFDDDAPGESADVVSILETDDKVVVSLFHCKYSSESKAGARVGELYEVCGQAMKSVKWRWNPTNLLKHLNTRVGRTVLGSSRILKGDLSYLKHLEKTLKHKEWEFRFSIVQPGVDAGKISGDMSALLAMTNSALLDTAGAKLNCIFS